MYATRDWPPIGFVIWATATRSHPSSPNVLRISPGLCSSSGATKYSHFCMASLPVLWRFLLALDGALDAGAHDDGHPVLLCDAPRLVIHDAQLQPQDLLAARDRFFGDRRRVRRLTEPVYDLDRDLGLHVQDRRV